MPWPNNLAAKIVSGYIGQKYDVLSSALRRFNPPMGAMPFFNNSASPFIRKAELALVAGGILKFLEELEIPLENDRTLDSAHTKLLEVLVKERRPSSDMIAIIDDHFKFRDEV
jgi:hypothetical protein